MKNKLQSSIDLFPELKLEEMDFSDLIGGWKELSSKDDRLPSIGWCSVGGELLIKLYFGDGSFAITVVDDGGVKERYTKDSINSSNQMLLWLLVREDTIRKCTDSISRKTTPKEIYDIVKSTVDTVDIHGFIGDIEAGEILYGGDIFIEVLEYFGLDPYKKY
jgi:hypothetical protein